MTTTNPARSINKLKSLAEKKITAVDEFLAAHPNELNTEEAAKLKKLITALEEQWQRMERKWEDLAVDFAGEESEYTALDQSVSEVEAHQKRILIAAELHIKEKSTNQPPTSGDEVEKHSWKPQVQYKPEELVLSLKPTSLDAWIRRLRAYLNGADTQDFWRVNVSLEEIISEDVRAAINFDPNKRIMLFDNSKDSLINQLQDLWKRRYPLARQRTILFETRSRDGEKWDEWLARLNSEGSKADIYNIDGKTVMALLAVMNYDGPHAQKLRAEISKTCRSDGITDDGKITQEAATAIIHAEEDAMSFQQTGTASHINKLHDQRNQTQRQNGGKSQNNKQNGGNNSQPKSKFSDHPHQKYLARNGHCGSCFKKECKNRACKGTNLECQFCKANGQKKFTGHVKEACNKNRDFITTGKKPVSTLAVVQEPQETQN